MPFMIQPSMGMRPGNQGCVSIPEGDEQAAKDFYHYKKNEILEDCIRNPAKYLEG